MKKTSKTYWNESKRSQEEEQYSESRQQLLYRQRRTGRLARMAIEAYREENTSFLTDIEIVKELAK